MVAPKTRRSAANAHVARLPDDRAVVGCAVTALVALLLMLLAGTAKAEQPDSSAGTCRTANWSAKASPRSRRRAL